MLNLLIGLGIGVLLGGVIGWLFAGRRAALVPAAPSLQPLVDELRAQLTARETAASQLQADLSAAKSQLATAQALQQSTLESAAASKSAHERTLAEAIASRDAAEQNAAALSAELASQRTLAASIAAKLAELEKTLGEVRESSRNHETAGAALRTQLMEAEKAKSELEARVKFLDENLKTERLAVETLHEKFRKDFEAISNRLLVENSDRFKEQSSKNLESLLTPLRDNLKEFRARLEDTHKESASQTAVLKDQISRIGTEAANLAKALKGDVKVLGNWGEHRLDQILDKAGLQLGVHYDRQQAAAEIESGQQRYLDVIVKLPENKHLIIDSKVSLVCYEAHINAPDDALRTLHLQKHIDCIRKHVKDLASKRYQDLYGINAPDFVLMYIPMESAFFAAVAQEPGLFSDALDKNVVLITNSTLLATLRTVAHVWRIAAQQANAADIAKRGGALYDKFCGFIADLDALGETLAAGRKHYDEAVKKLHQGRGNLVRQADELKTLGARATKSLPEPLVEKARLSEEAPLLQENGSPDFFGK